MRTRSQARKRRVISQFAGLSLIVAFLAGCGGSSEVKELPEASKKTLIQRKVDVEQRPAKSLADRPGLLERTASSSVTIDHSNGKAIA